jgi:hypothetical protein
MRRRVALMLGGASNLMRRQREDDRIANRSALNEKAAQGNLSQFNSLDLALPWFGTRRSKVQILSPRPLF